MDTERPDLSQVAPSIRAYIETLEAELKHLRQGKHRAASSPDIPLDVSEPPTTLNVITISRNGLAKRTPRHLYTRQRRSGMGIFDMECPPNDPPTLMTIADEDYDLLLITTKARLFRLPLKQLPESAIRSRGQSLLADLPLVEDEHLALLLPHQHSGYLVTVTTHGYVRRQRHHLFGDMMNPGMLLYDTRTVGPPAAACWTSGQYDLFITTHQGRAIRFAEQLIPSKGCQGIRLEKEDTIIAINEVQPAGGVFLLGADGKGTMRLMSGFSANKAPGAGGKIAMKATHLIGAVNLTPTDDIFIISRLSKIIRFQAAEIPAKEGVVQGVNCMTLRADEPVALVPAKFNK